MELLDTKGVELSCTMSENETLKQVLVEVKTELENARKKVKVNNKCNECDTNVESYDQLRLHIRHYHSQNKSSQYEMSNKVEEYPCFYCDEPIISEDNLEAHKNVCCEIPNDTIEPAYQEVVAFPCGECGAQYTSIDDLGRHKTDYHTSLELSEDPGGKLFWCDICPLYFEKDRDLMFHKRGCHWDHM